MKKLVYTAFIAFWTAIGTLLAVHALAPDAGAENQGTLPVYTLEDVAGHDTEGDCWMVIEGKVYDFTAYIPEHPAPPPVMMPWCGKEATEGMRTKGYGRDHSPAAWAMTQDYLIGLLEEN